MVFLPTRYLTTCSSAAVIRAQSARGVDPGFPSKGWTMRSWAFRPLSSAIVSLIVFLGGGHKTAIDNSKSTAASPTDGRPVPSGFPREYLAELMAIADQTAQHCEKLLNEPNCYCHNCSQSGGADGDLKIAVPLKKGHLEGDKRLRLLHARCAQS